LFNLKNLGDAGDIVDGRAEGINGVSGEGYGASAFEQTYTLLNGL
jgi:hypothetical protein